MDIQQLQRMGVLVSNPLIKKTITIKYFPLKPEETWENPTIPEREEERVEGDVDFWIRKLSALDNIALNAIKDPAERVYAGIQRSIFNEQGELVFPDLETARCLDLEMFAPLLIAMNELNKGASKKSQPKTNSGVNSVSPSAARTSKRSKARSPKKT
jgi:hypothetical protein